MFYFRIRMNTTKLARRPHFGLAEPAQYAKGAIKRRVPVRAVILPRP